MKSLAVITTSLLLTLASAGGTAVFAEEGETVYPQNGEFIKPLEFSDLNDYEIEDGVYYFLDGETCFRYENGNRTVLDTEKQFTPAQSEVSIGSYTFRLLDTTLKAGDYDSEEFTTFGDGFSSLKKFGDSAYAVKDNVLYTFNSKEQPQAVSLEYVDYGASESVSVGQTAELLKTRDTLTFVTVKAGAYMTKADLTALDGEYFVSDGDTGTVETVTAEQDLTALLLCYTGNAAVISVGDTSYITLNSPSSLEETQINCKSEAEFSNATIIGNRIYATPFTVTGTTALPEATGTIVTVKSKLEYEGVLNSAYYEVEYTTADGTAKTGYVAYGHLTEYIIEDNKEPDVIPDPEHSEKTNVTTVLLILAVVVLVLSAIGYIVYTATSGKKKKGENEPEAEDGETEENTEQGAEPEEDKEKPKKKKKGLFRRNK